MKRPPDSIVEFTQRMGSEEIQQLSDWTQHLESERNELKARVETLERATKAAAELYDKMSIETNPLACAATYGPDYIPPSHEEWDEMCIEVRQMLREALEEDSS